MKMYSIQHSEALDGFYQSSIFVIAANKEQAKEKIRVEAKRLIGLKDLDYYKFEDIGKRWLIKKQFFSLLEKDF